MNKAPGPLSGIDRSVLTLMLLSAGQRIASFTLPFLALAYAGSNSWSDGRVSPDLAVAAYSAGGFLGVLATPHLMQRTSLRMCAASLGLAGCAALLTLVLFGGRSHFDLLVLFLYGSAGESLRPVFVVAFASLSDRLGARATALRRISVNAGTALGPAVGMFFFAYSFRALLIAEFFLTLLFVGFLVARPPSALLCDAHRSARQDTSIQRKAGGLQWCQPRLFYAFIIMFFPVFVMSQMFGAMPITIERAIGAAGIPILFGINGATIIIAELFVVHAARALPATQTAVLGFLLMVGGFAWILLADSVPPLVAAVLIFSVGEILVLPILEYRMVGLVPASSRATMASALMAGGALATLIGPAVGVHAVHEASPVLLGLVGGGALLVFAIVSYIGLSSSEPMHD